MFPFWDVISVAFVGGILLLKRFRERCSPDERLVGPPPVLPAASKRDCSEISASLVKFSEDGLLENSSSQVFASDDHATTTIEASKDKPSVSSTGSRLGWLHEALADEVLEATRDAEMPQTCLTDSLSPEAFPEQDVVPTEATKSALADIDVRKAPPVSFASDKLAEAVADTLFINDASVVSGGIEASSPGARQAEPALQSEPAESDTPIAATALGSGEERIDLEDQIRQLEQQVEAGDAELKQMEEQIFLPTRETTSVAERGKKRRQSAKKKKSGSRDLVPVVSWVKRISDSTERAMPIPGIPGEFTADQILGLVRRLWENRESARPEVRQQVEEFLPRVVPSLVKVAESSQVPESIRYDAVLLLGNVRAQEALSALTRMVRDQLPAIRYAAATSLAAYSADEAVAPLLDALRDRHSLVRASAAQSLGKLCPTPALPALVKSLADSSRRVRLLAQDAVRQYPVEELSARLPFILPRASDAAVRRALNTIAADQDERRFEVMRELLKARHPAVLTQTVRMAMKLADPRWADELADATRFLEEHDQAGTTCATEVVPDTFRGSLSQDPAVAPAPPTTEQPMTEQPTATQAVENSPAVPLSEAKPRRRRAKKQTQKPIRQDPVKKTNQTARPEVPATPTSPASDTPSSADQVGKKPERPAAVEQIARAPQPVQAVTCEVEIPTPQKTFDLVSYRERFRNQVPFEQVRCLRQLFDEQFISFEDLSGLYGAAAGPFVKSLIIDELKRHGSTAEPFLLLCLKEPEEETVLAAIKTLAEIGSDLALDSLAMLKRHASPHVRFTTEIAIEKVRARKGKA